jgi:hypothetical protein
MFKRPLAHAAAAIAVLALFSAGALVGRAQIQPAQTQMDEYVRYELGAPASSSISESFEVSATTEKSGRYTDPIVPGTIVTEIRATDMMTGQPLVVTQNANVLSIALARPVSHNGQARIRLEKTIKDARGYTLGDSGLATFSAVLPARRGVVALPAGFELVACNIASQVLSLPDGRVSLAFMNQSPGATTLVVKLRGGVKTSPPTPLTDKRSWEPPPAQGPTERARLTERAHQDRDITYFLQDPSTNSFSLFHDYTESRPGVDKYVNVVRTGSRVSNPSAYILDTGEALKHDTLKGDAITAARIDAGTVTPDTEVVVVYFPAVKAGQSVRLRISETYAAPESYRLEGADLVFDRSLGRPRNSVVLPAGWYLTASSIPAVISETADQKIRLDYFNGRNDGLDVLIKGRKR